MRKPTSIVHVGLGVLCALVAFNRAGLAAILFFGFALYEYWSERRGLAGGHEDFCEALLGLSLGCAALVLAWLAQGGVR